MGETQKKEKGLMKGKRIGDGRRKAAREAVDDPNRLAKLYLRRHHRHGDGLTLRRWREEWLRWDGSSYRKVQEEELRANVLREVLRYFRQLHRRGVERRPHVRKVPASL